MIDWNKLTPLLRKPFHPSNITWKPGATNGNKDAALGMAYADLRAYQDRLDELLPGQWSVSYTPWGDRIICNLTINGITRSSTGEPDAQSERSEIAGTATEAQSFKRACSCFGLGRYLYNLPSVWADYDGQRRQFTEKGKQKLDKVVWDHYRQAQTATVQDVDDNCPGSPAHDDPDIVGRPTEHEQAIQRAARQRVTGVDGATGAKVAAGATKQDAARSEAARRAVQVISQLAVDGAGEASAPVDPGGLGQAIWPEEQFMGPTKGAKDVGVFVWPTSADDLDQLAATELVDESSPVTRMIRYLRQKDEASEYPMKSEPAPGKRTSQYGYLVSLVNSRYGKDSHSAILATIFGRVVSKENPPGGMAKELLDWIKDETDSLKYVDELVAWLKEAWASQ